MNFYSSAKKNRKLPNKRDSLGKMEAQPGDNDDYL